MTSTAFRVSPGQYVSRVMSMWCARHWWVLALPPAVCCCLTVRGWEWAVVALMIVLVVYPAVLAMVYFRYGLTPDCASAIGWKRVSLGHDGTVVITYLDPITDTDTGQVSFNPTHTGTVNIADVGRVSDTGKGILIRLRKPRFAHIFIPESALGDIKTAWLERLSENGIKFA